MASGVTMTTTLLAKDTAHKTAWPVFTAGGGFDMAEMQGGGDFVMVADPTTFQVLPWAPNTGWLLCDIYFANGRPVPFSTRQILRDALARLAAEGFGFLAGLEVEFHLFKLENPRLAPADATWPPRAPEVSLLNQGYQYLTESRFDQIGRGAGRRSAAVSKRSVCRCARWKSNSDRASANSLSARNRHLPPLTSWFCSAPRPSRSRAGTACWRASCAGPRLPHLFSSGWHLHQSLQRRGGGNAFAGDARDGLSATGLHYLGGPSRPCRRQRAAFSTPTVNGYRRYRAYTLAPDRVIWARDNRGVHDPRARPARASRHAFGKSHRRAGGQSVSLHGVANLCRPRRHGAAPRSRTIGRHAVRDQSADVADRFGAAPFQRCARARCCKMAFGASFVDYYTHLKEAELARFKSEAGSAVDGSDVTAWEQNEYFDLFVGAVVARPKGPTQSSLVSGLLRWRSQ